MTRAVARAAAQHGNGTPAAVSAKDVKCIRRYAPAAVKKQRFLSSRVATGRCTAAIVSAKYKATTKILTKKRQFKLPLFRSRPDQGTRRKDSELKTRPATMHAALVIGVVLPHILHPAYLQAAYVYVQM